MTRRLSRRTANPVTRRLAEIVADCNYASRRSVERNAPWMSRHDATSTQPRR